MILEHSKAPRNFRKPAAANQEAEGFNPLCGDRCTVFIDMDGDAIKDIGFQGSGCAISRASASMMTQMLKGKTKEEAVSSSSEFHRPGHGQRRRDGASAGVGQADGVLPAFRSFPRA